jgi:hypothetical protein
MFYHFYSLTSTLYMRNPTLCALGTQKACATGPLLQEACDLVGENVHVVV